jgi:hypothetical protein
MLLATLFLFSGGAPLLASNTEFAQRRNALAEVAQQPDPKKKEITASISRSADDETILLNTSFPDDAAKIRVTLYNMIGRLIQVHPVTAVDKGDYSFRFQTIGLPTGPYIVVLESNGQRIVNKIMLSR